MGDFDTKEIDTLEKNDLITLFNDFLYDLLGQLNDIVKDEDLAYCHGMFQSAIGANRTLVIDQFVINVLEYYEPIKNKDVDFFLKDEKSIKKYEGEVSVVNKIFKFKSLFTQLKKKHQDMLFYFLNILCYISARYFSLTHS
jgi:hypothetical protein